MVGSQRVRTARAAGAQGVTRNGQQNQPCEKIIVRLRPVLQDELASGETQCALTTTHRGEVKLKLEAAPKRRHKTSTGKGFGDGKRQQQQQQQQQQQREGLPTVFQVDTVLGPGNDTSEVYAAAASRLVDRAITGGRALLLIAGTPGSGRSHTLWGTPSPRQHNFAAAPVAATATGIEEQGLLPLALADLSRRWSCGNGSPFYHSSSAASAASAGSSVASRKSSTPAEMYSPSPCAPPLSFRLCVAEVLPGGDRETSNSAAGRVTSRTARGLLLRGPFSVVSRPSTPGGGDGDIGEKKVATRSPSPSPPRRWALSARDALAGLASSSSVSPPRSSFDRSSGRRRSGGVGLKSRAWMGMRRGRGGVAAAEQGSLVTSRVLGGVEEVSAEGLEEALALVREGLSNRRGEGHVVISAKLVTATGNATRVGPTPDRLTETGELVFVELGDCPNGGLPQTLRNALSHLKIGRDHQEPLGPHTTTAPPRSGRVAAVTGTADAPPIPKKQHRGSNNSPTDNNLPNNEPLWALLSAFAQPPGPRGVGTVDMASPVKGPTATASTGAAAVTGTWAVEGKGAAGSRLSLRHSGATAVAAAEDIGAGSGWSASASAAVASDGPLVVSVVATLRSGDASYLEDKALLEALAKSSRTRPDSWRSLPLGRILVSMPSFSWWSSHPGRASAAAAAAAMAAADGSAPAPPSAAPSAPPMPSSEEVSLATSNYSSSRSGSSSLSDGGLAEGASAVTVAVASSASASGAGLSAGTRCDGAGSRTSLSKAASVAAEGHGIGGGAEGSVPGSSNCGGGGGGGDKSKPREATVPKHLEGATSDGDDDVLAAGGQDERPRSKSGRRAGDGGNSGGGLLTIEGADEAADKDDVHRASAGQKDERRVSPPWDDSTLGLLGLSQDELIGRVLQAEKQSRHWQAQHALVERKLAALLAVTESQQTFGGRVGTSRVPPTVGGAADLPGSTTRWTAGRLPEDLPGCSPDNGTQDKPMGEGNGELTAPPYGVSPGITSNTTDALNEADSIRAREHRGGADGGESGGSCGSRKGDEDRHSTPDKPGTTPVDSAPGRAPPSSGGVSGGRVETIPVHDNMADHLPQGGIVAADNGESEGIHDSSPPQPLTFKERRAVFSPNKSVPVPPTAASLGWSAVANTTAADAADAGKAGDPKSSFPRPSLPRAGTRTSPHFSAFSSAAVEAARQNLKRSKLPSNRDSTAAARGHAATTPGRASCQKRETTEGDGKRERPRVSPNSRSPPQSAASVSSAPLSQGTSAVAHSSSPAPCTPSRPLHHRRTSAPSPPAPSPCSTADRYRTTPGSPDSSSSAGGPRGGGKLSSEGAPSSSPRSPSFSPPAPGSTPSSPQLASPPSFPKPNAERRRARAREAESGNWTTAFSLSMASSVLKSPPAAQTAMAAAASARLPPTAPSAAPGGIVFPPASAYAATSTPPQALTSGSTDSTSTWSGTALRQKSVRLQHSPGSASFASAASSLPSPRPEEGGVGAASTAPRVAGEVQGATGRFYRGIGGSGGGGRETRREGFHSSNGFSAYAPGNPALSRTSFRDGGSGGRFEDDWKERPAGIGPWPLFEQTREGRASLDEKRGITNGGSGLSGCLSGGRVEEAGTPAVAATEAVEATDPEVSIGNISTMQASRLRALREKMERRYWPRGTALSGGTATNPASVTDASASSATVPDGPKSLDRQPYLGLRQVFR